MKLLILTQKIDINDDVLGFFHGWVNEFAKHCEQVTVICLFRGEYDLPSNVKVLSLGKESSKCKIKYLYRFFKYIWQERNNYDSVFVHMNQIYVVLGGLFWRVWRKKVSLWYAHGHVPFGLRVAEKLVDNIFTSTKSGCRLESKKIEVVGQGIDTEIFKPLGKKTVDNIFRILFVGRISPVKDIETLIEAVRVINFDAELKNKTFKVDIVGGLGLKEQKDYSDKLISMVNEIKLDKVINFVGPVPSYRVNDYFKKADFFVNTSCTGSLDKVILEAMSCELIIGSSNESLLEILGKYRKQLMFEKGDFLGLAEMIKKFINMDNEKRKEIGSELRQIVIRDHSLNILIKNIISKMR